jgi:HTH-type transcriptional regulator/antitoxin MqsA
MFDRKEYAMTAQELCPLCGEGHVTSRSEEVEQSYGGHRSSVPMYFRSCDHCGSDFAGAAESGLNKRAMMGLRKRVDGLLPAANIVAIRAKYRITQAQAAKLFGGGPVAFSKYENDDVAQSSAMDTLLRLVEANESAFWTLIEQKGMKAEFTRTEARPAMSSQASYRIQRQAPDAGPSPVYQPKEFRRFDGGDKLTGAA